MGRITLITIFLQADHAMGKLTESQTISYFLPKNIIIGGRCYRLCLENVNK